MECIVCGRELENDEVDECSSCKRVLDTKYKGDKRGREDCKKYFKWLRKKEKDSALEFY